MVERWLKPTTSDQCGQNHASKDGNEGGQSPFPALAKFLASPQIKLSIRTYMCSYCSSSCLLLLLVVNVVNTYSFLHARLRTSTLRHDEEGQAVLINLLLRNYFHYNLYDQVC